MKYNQNIDNKIVLSNRIFTIVIFYIFFAIIFRILLPYGDEPDFMFRVYDILNSKILYSHYYFFLEFLNGYNWIDIKQESFEQKLLRIIITLFAMMPIILLILFKKPAFGISVNKDFEQRKKALALSLIMPGMIYYLGVFAEEQFTLLLSLVIFLFWNNKYILIALSSLVVMIDFGNSIVLIIFILFFKFTEYLSRKYSIKLMISIFITIILVSYFVGLKLILILSSIPILGDKVTIVYEAYTTYYAFVATKYPLIYRPFITFMTFVFMTPAKIGAYVLYPIYGYALLFAVIRFSNKTFFSNEISKKYFIYFISPIVFVISMVFILPGYSQAKYYMFSVPFILYGLLGVFHFRSIGLFFIFSNLIVVISLLWNLL